jgi:TonB-dependent SusC/RagA subfamily outer membrane receptor
MTVLKDASATAIYGSRASNGVIIITTKKGGKNLEVEYNVQLGIGRRVNQISVFSASDFRNIVQVRQNQLLAADPTTPAIISWGKNQGNILIVALNPPSPTCRYNLFLVVDSTNARNCPKVISP